MSIMYKNLQHMTLLLLTDIPECKLYKTICNRFEHSKCVELPGSYYCACHRGYVKDYKGHCKGRCVGILDSIGVAQRNI